MDFSFILEHFTAVVVVACLEVGYLLKHVFTKFPNKYIPAVLAIIGAVANALVSGMAFDSVVYGAAMGLCSTGLHQAFKGFVEKKAE